MRKIKIVLSAALSCAVIGALSYTVSASSAGTSDDPLVTKSYVGTAVSNILSAINGSLGNGTLSDTSGSSQAFQPVQVFSGQVLKGGEGAEIILRSGSAVSYCEGENGVIDVTSGTEYFNGSEISPNHLIIVSRDDGRGAKVTSSEAWFIVKGGYTIEWKHWKGLFQTYKNEFDFYVVKTDFWSFML